MYEVKFSGFGGQGIIRSGFILGRACAIYEEKHATLNQSFGPEARGGACSAQVIVSDTRILYPYLTTPDIVVSMSQEAYSKYGNDIKENGILIIDDDLVKLDKPKKKVRIYKIPATRFAEELGNKIVTNVVMLGFFTAVTGIVSSEAMKKAIPGSVPERATKLNLKAFDKGYEYGIKQIKKN